jgi:hypothetical protein
MLFNEVAFWVILSGVAVVFGIGIYRHFKGDK